MRFGGNIGVNAINRTSTAPPSIAQPLRANSLLGGMPGQQQAPPGAGNGLMGGLGGLGGSLGGLSGAGGLGGGNPLGGGLGGGLGGPGGLRPGMGMNLPGGLKPQWTPQQRTQAQALAAQQAAQVQVQQVRHLRSLPLPRMTSRNIIWSFQSWICKSVAECWNVLTACLAWPVVMMAEMNLTLWGSALRRCRRCGWRLRARRRRRS
jgi:hypothetical protein